MAPLHDALVALGATVEPGETWGHLPVTVAGPLRGADAVMMPGDVSSQYITALMLIGPLHPRRSAPLVVDAVGVGVVSRHHRGR